jgi:hypothetical protein
MRAKYRLHDPDLTVIVVVGLIVAIAIMLAGAGT